MNLSENELLIAIRKSLINSEDLISDAELLKKNERLPRAYALYQLAIEETGKAMNIYANIILGISHKTLCKNFKNHIAKAQIARMLSVFYSIELIKTDTLNGEKLLEWTLLEIKDASMLNDYKNYSLYTSFIDNTYKTPKEIINIDR